MYLAHIACASNSGPQCVVDSVRQAQPPWSSLLLPSLSFSFSLMKPKAPLEVIKLSTALNFEFF
jgi:hypothetical protein